MLTRLKLTNYEKHEDLTLEFTEGLQVLRGPNEAGKSAIFRATGYAWWGARALPWPLDETVTWGKPVPSLRVELDFVHAGVSYNIIRKHSGAELRGSDGVTASGQAEVTAFVERLFNASAAVGRNTMFANQKSLTDSLGAGSMTLIERLANMKMIDDLMDKVQKSLPTGNTKVLEAQVQQMGDLVEPVLDDAELKDDYQLARTELETAEVASKAAWQVFDEAKVAANIVIDKQNANARAESAANTYKQQLSAVSETVQGLEFYLGQHPELQDLTELLQGVQATKQAAVLQAAYNVFQVVDQSQSAVGRVELKSKGTDLAIRDGELNSKLATVKTEIVRQQTLLITETACGLCGKDLQSVPEVVEKNSKTQARIAELQNEQSLLTAELLTLSAQRNDIRVYFDADERVKKAVRSISHLVTINEEVIPAQVTWEGPTPQVLEARDWEGELKTAQELNAQITSKRALLTQMQQQKAQLENSLAAIVFVQLSEVDLQAQEFANTKRADYETCSQVKLRAEQAVNTTFNRLAVAQATYASEKKAYDASKASHAEMLKLLDQYHRNNGIITKLRAARPQVAKKLWSLVLSGISHYFSQVRGFTSIVGRDDKGFTIDGKTDGKHSGSTVDSLGLAVRIMLQKTFLPNIDFMLVDEPAAACDDEREAAMIAQFASCGFGQVILVTHSPLADSFAAKVHQI